MNKKQDLTAEQKHILHKEGTEASGSSSLNNEKREGSYLLCWLWNKII